MSDKGLSYKLENAPFEFQYSYTETPKVKPLALREQPFLPFGPDGVKRPWTGRRPLPESKKKLPEFDSFKPPPAGKKGVKTVQNPGPFLVGMGPKVTPRSREEILGEELTTEEVKDLVKGCVKTKRQLNMGRDGLTHNMLDNIHAHWKRRRVCKIKCKGVCTVDMDNVRQQLEEKTGGKIIYSKGGIIFLFRGRNYNYRTRPRYPLMLWKPVTPVYPRLVQRAPEGLTLEEASDMRKRGRKLLPICKLGKNGVYTNLVKNVKEAFEACELARIDCTGLHKSDCRKIGAKLKDLVPCVLISFEYEHILMWRGRDWKSSLPPLESKHIRTTVSSTSTSSDVSGSEVQESVDSLTENSSDMNQTLQRTISSSITISNVSGSEVQESVDPLTECSSDMTQTLETSHVIAVSTNDGSAEECPSTLGENMNSPGTSYTDFKHTDGAENIEDENMMSNDIKRPENRHLDALKLLVAQAIESGRAIILEDEALDADIVYERSVALAKTAPPGPAFRHKLKRVLVQKNEKENKNSEERVIEVETISNIPEKRVDKSLRSKRRDDVAKVFLEVVPRGSLGVDELAKLLS